MEFEWDEKKNHVNQQKHGVSFVEAITVFNDPRAVSSTDDDHTLDEERFLTFGYSHRQRILAVAHTDRDGSIRMISARPATPSERRNYEQS